MINPKRMRKINWADGEVEKMLCIIRDDKILNLLDGKKYRKLEIFSAVAEKMKKSGYDRSPEQIRTKLKVLKRNYIEAKRINMNSVVDGTETEFFDLLEEIYSNFFRFTEAKMSADVELLISEIEKRPAIYKKQSKGYNDTDLKEKLWIDICERVFSNWKGLSTIEKKEKCKETQSRWKNLKTCFEREYIAQKNTPPGASGNKRRKYMFFDQLLFLVPIIENQKRGDDIHFSTSDNETTEESCVIEEQRISMPAYIRKRTGNLQYPPTTDNENTEESCAIEEQRMSMSGYVLERTANLQYPLNIDNEHTEESFTIEEKQNPMPGYVRKRAGNLQYSTTDNENTEESCIIQEQRTTIPRHTRKKKSKNLYVESLLHILDEKKETENEIDEDKYFLLSLLPAFKKFDDEQKFIAQTEILKVMRSVKLSNNIPPNYPGSSKNVHTSSSNIPPQPPSQSSAEHISRFFSSFVADQQPHSSTSRITQYPHSSTLISNKTHHQYEDRENN